MRRDLRRNRVGLAGVACELDCISCAGRVLWCIISIEVHFCRTCLASHEISENSGSLEEFGVDGMSIEYCPVSSRQRVCSSNTKLRLHGDTVERRQASDQCLEGICSKHQPPR